MNTQLADYFDEINGQQFDDENWISLDEDNQVHIENVFGYNEDWPLTEPGLTEAISHKQGETRRALRIIRNLLVEA